MQQTTANLTVLFADIAGSSRLYELLGGDHARQLITDFLNELSDTARKNRGEALLTIGDELMCAFESANDAIAAAAAMNQIADAHPPVLQGDFGAVGLYIRIDTGRVIREGNELFGDAVNSAAKMKTLGKPYQILISKTTRKDLSSDHKRLTRFVGNLPIKGITGTFDIFEFIWDEEDITQMIDPQPETKPSVDVLEITIGPEVLMVDENNSMLTIGRLPANDLVLKYSCISRMHAKIEHRRGKFVLVDASANGTYVQISGQDILYLKNDELQLHGKGFIYPGKRSSSDSPGAIRFSIRT